MITRLVIKINSYGMKLKKKSIKKPTQHKKIEIKRIRIKFDIKIKLN